MQKKGRLRKCLWCAGIIVINGFFLFPVLWLTLTAFKPPQDVFYVLSSFAFSYQNFIGALKWPSFALAIKNSFLLASLATASSLLVTIMSGYLVGRYNNMFSNTWFGVVYVTRTIPYIAWVLPLYLLVLRFNLYDTLPGLLLPHITIHLAFFTFIMKGFFERIPKEIEDAAHIDGCSRWGVFWKIALPLTIPGIAALAILCWLFTWNEFLFAFILTSEKIPLLPIVTIQFIHEFGMHWDLMSAAGVIGVLPGLLMCIIAGKYVVKGLTLSLK